MHTDLRPLPQPWFTLAISLALHVIFASLHFPAPGPTAAPEPAPPPLTASLRQPSRAALPAVSRPSPRLDSPRVMAVAVPPQSAPRHALLVAPGGSEASPAESAGMDTESLRAEARRLARLSAAPAGNDPGRAAQEDPGNTPLARAVASARTADCRDKYAGLGVLGLPLLLRDSVTRSGCVW